MLKLEYLSFPHEEITTIIGKNKIHLFTIPKGDPWGRPMGIDDISAYLQVGPPKYDEMPPNSVFIRGEMIDLADFESRCDCQVTLNKFTQIIFNT